MADYLKAFKNEDLSFGTQADLFVRAADPMGIINFFDGPFLDALAPQIDTGVSLLVPEDFLGLAVGLEVGEYGVQSREGWEMIIPPYIEDLNAGFFEPRSVALPPPAPATTAPPIVGATSSLFISLLANTVPRETARKLTNALFSAVEDDLIAAGPAFVAKPVIVPPYTAVPA